MPIYTYVCTRCDDAFESFLRRMDAPTPGCASCGRADRVERTVAGYAFHKDTQTKLNESDPKYAKMVDAAWEQASASDPISRTRFGGGVVDSGRRMQDV
ncbi:MAG: Zinc ribbon domain-containing protein [Chloroflexi bacterium]|nr:MAG: Zinc ribbon domain-containing protein [Chloroflexota bacterium]